MLTTNIAQYQDDDNATPRQAVRSATASELQYNHLFSSPLSVPSLSSLSSSYVAATPLRGSIGGFDYPSKNVTYLPDAGQTQTPSHTKTPLSPRDPNTPISSLKRTSRKPSPRLIERLYLLRARGRRSLSLGQTDQAPGRIPDSQIKLLDDLHKSHEVTVDRKKPFWLPVRAPPLDLELASGAGDLTVPRSHLGMSSSMAAWVHESDASSIISVSDRLVPSDSEPEPDPHADNHKYRLPDAGKSRGSSRNGFILEDSSAMDRERPPTPPPKDAPPTHRNSYASPAESPAKEGAEFDNYPYFNPGNLSRTASIYTLSRASFSNQLSQLTSIRLPQAASLAQSIAAIPTSAAACRSLNDASGQIGIWINKVREVLEGLDSEDDIEWAAAGGREGLGEVDAAICRFEGLIDVYVSAVEQLETRSDIGALGSADLEGVVDRMDRITQNWQNIKNALQDVKKQVELAMEWEELWNTVLGEIGQEVEALNRLIFEMEERRHRGILDALAEPGKVLDINELETIVEEAPSRSNTVARKHAPRGDSTPQQQSSDEDKNLVGLLARMQPLRASLDFFPMRLSAFVHRGRDTFPTGCEELEKRHEFLEAKYRKIESDAESLRRELGEDRWVIVFRKASEKALKMSESVDRSIAKLRGALEDGLQHTQPSLLAKKLESYEAKKEHYGPAIQQVLGIIDKGVQTRLTVNGEILRLQADMRQRWRELEANIKGMDFAIEQLQISNLDHQLRDSISTVLSEQRSVSSSMMDTPGSSPASSVVLLSRQSSDQGASTPFAKSRTGSFASSTTARSATGKRLSSLPTSLTSSTSAIIRKTPLSRSSATDLRPAMGVSSRLYSTPTPVRSFSRAGSQAESSRSDKPRWNFSTNMQGTTTGHNFKPLSATTPSPYRKDPPTPETPQTTSTGHFGQPSPLGGISSTFKSGLRPPSALNKRRPTSALANNHAVPDGTSLPRLKSQQSTSAIPTTRPGPTPSKHVPQSSISSLKGSTSQLPRSSFYGAVPSTPTHAAPSGVASSAATTGHHGRKTSAALSSLGDESAGTDADVESTPSSKLPRPNTSMAGRRVSMLPQPKRVSSSNDAVAAATSAMNGRTSRTAVGRRSSMAFMPKEQSDHRPKWRG